MLNVPAGPPLVMVPVVSVNADEPKLAIEGGDVIKVDAQYPSLV